MRIVTIRLPGRRARIGQEAPRQPFLRDLADSQLGPGGAPLRARAARPTLLLRRGAPIGGGGRRSARLPGRSADGPGAVEDSGVRPARIGAGGALHLCGRPDPVQAVLDARDAALRDGRRMPEVPGQRSVHLVRRYGEATYRRGAGPDSGAPARVRCAQCHKPGTACPGCEGKGFKVCTTCRGTGAVKCPHCDGEGSSRHDECDGTGTVTLYTAGTVAYTTRPDSLNLPEPPPPLRVRRMTALGGAWERVTLTEAGAPLPDGLDPSHLKAVESALAPRRDEVSRRAELRLLRLAQVVLRDDQDHVFYVFPGRNGPEGVPDRGVPGQVVSSSRKPTFRPTW